MISNPRNRVKTKFYNFHNDYGHLTKDFKQLKWEEEKLVKRGSFKEFFQNSNNTRDAEKEENSRKRHGKKQIRIWMRKRKLMLQ